MKLAIAEAQLAQTNGELPVGAVLVCDGEVIASAHNQTKLLGKPIAHAELLAIEKAYQSKKTSGDYLDDCDIYVTLEPCLMCYKALSLVRIRRIYYAAKNPKQRSIEKYSLADLDINHKCEIYGGIMEEEAGSLLKEFFLSRRS